MPVQFIRLSEITIRYTFILQINHLAGGTGGKILLLLNNYYATNK